MSEKDKLIISALSELLSAVKDLRDQLERQNVVAMDEAERLVVYGPIYDAIDGAAHCITHLSRAALAEHEAKP